MNSIFFYRNFSSRLITRLIFSLKGTLMQIWNFLYILAFI